MKKSFVFIVTFLAASVSLATHAQEEPRDFKGVLQCRTIEDSSQRLSCYDNSIPPTRTKSAKKFESRDQCPDEKTDEKRLTCYDRFSHQRLNQRVQPKPHLQVQRLVKTR
jgi:type VI secretion system protein VasI